MRMEEGGTPMDRAMEAKRVASDWNFFPSSSEEEEDDDDEREDGSPVRERVRRPEWPEKRRYL